MRFKEYEEAYQYAKTQAKAINRDMGLERADNPLEGKGFNVFHLPNPENRCGYELRCEVVTPQAI